MTTTSPEMSKLAEMYANLARGAYKPLENALAKMVASATRSCDHGKVRLFCFHALFSNPV
jgi:hypothetical protein